MTIKLSNLQLSKLKTTVKNNEGTTLRISNKNFNKQELPHELFLTQQQTTKLRNKIENNMSAEIKQSINKTDDNVRRCFRICFNDIFTKIN